MDAAGRREGFRWTGVEYLFLSREGFRGAPWMRWGAVKESAGRQGNMRAHRFFPVVADLWGTSRGPSGIYRSPAHPHGLSACVSSP